MVRIVLSLFVLCVAILVAALFYLPWWGFSLTFIGVFLGLMVSARWLSGRIGTMLFTIPFRAKGATLRKARAEVHAVEAVAPVACEGDQGEGPLESYTIDVTIVPRPNPGPFKFWEPGELAIVPASAKISGLDDIPERVGVSGVEVFQDGRFGPDEGMKYFGPQRLRLLLGTEPGAERRQKFLYYFEAFGKVTLPPPLPVQDAENGRDDEGLRKPERTRP